MKNLKIDDFNENIFRTCLKGKEVKLPVQPLPPQPAATAVVASASGLNYNQLPETEKYKTVFPNG